jgi:hypothetical protein
MKKLRGLMVAACALVVMGGSAWAQGNPNPGLGILPPQAKLLGKSLGDWGGEWWQWALAIPRASNPVWDLDGTYAAVNQSGPVWFLAGTFGFDATRTVTIPAGKHLFFPLQNTCWWAPDDLEFAAFVVEFELGLDPSLLTDLELLKLTAAYYVSLVSELSLEIDGVSAGGLFTYRGISSEPFPLYISDVYEEFDIPEGQRDYATSDGYWIMLSPLKPGPHTIRFTAATTDGFSLDVTYNITITPGPKK